MRIVLKTVALPMIICVLILSLVNCSEIKKPESKLTDMGKRQVKIGISMATLQEERWKRDRDIMLEEAKNLGAFVIDQSANGNESLQNSQAENLITQGIDVLIIVPQNSDSASPIIELAHKSGVKVIAYDRLIRNCDLNFYLSFDCTQVGKIQATAAVSKAPKGNYMLIGGSPTDNNAHLIRDGQMAVLKPYIDNGDIKIVVDQWTNDWNPEEALKYVEEGLTANKNNVQAIITSNDDCAGAAIQALSEQRLAGKVIVTGLDADLAACQRIVEGTQSMTIYRRFKKLGQMTIDVAVNLARGQVPSGNITKVNNGKHDVPSILLNDVNDMFGVEANNMNILIKDNWLKVNEIYKNIPKDKWPQ